MPPPRPRTLLSQVVRATEDKLDVIGCLGRRGYCRIGCVVFTTCAVAAVAHWLLGVPLAVGFVLGAIASPPDVVAPLSIVRRLGVPGHEGADVGSEHRWNPAVSSMQSSSNG
jgi:hypothetical protein